MPTLVAPAPLPDAQVVAVRPVVVPAPGRRAPLHVRVSAPVTGGALPIVLLAHGYAGSMTAYDPLVDHWAADGFVVVQPTFLDAPEHGLTPADPDFATIWLERARDLVRVLDALDVVLDAVHGLTDRTDTGRIAVAGHSWGGQSVGMLLGARVLDEDGRPGQDRTDPRVRAGILLATTGLGDDLTPFAREAFPFMRPDFSGLTTPTLVVAGDADRSALSTRGPDWFTDVHRLAPGARDLLTLVGGEHMLGGIHGYGARDTTDEDPHRVDVVRRGAAAWVRTALGVDAAAWPGFRARIAGSPDATVTTR